MIRKPALFFSMLCMFSMLFSIQQLQAQQQDSAAKAPPPARKIPGINAVDPFPHACVDCHIDYPEMKLDARFGTMMAQWNQQVPPELLAKAQASAPKGVTLKGKHPKAAFALQDIPAKCLVCHTKASKMAPPFAAMLHNIHLTGGEQNHFMTMFQGECTYCHKLDTLSGNWSIPSGPEK